MLYKPAEILSKVYEHALDPFLGYLHEQNNAQTPLVYDISECWKFFVDLQVISMANNNQLRTFHFNKKPDGACLLSTKGKEFFLKEWNLRLRKTIIKDDNRISYSELIRQDILGFKAFIEEETEFRGYRL